MCRDLGQRLKAVGDHARSESFDVFRQHLEPAWIEAALKTTGTLSLRRRKLPAESAVWTVIGMALLRDRSIQEVVHHLGLVLPAEDQPATVTGSAILQARDRLGEEPLAAVFAQIADHWVDRSADQHRWRGLRVYGVDGSTLRIPDTQENEAAFGRPNSGRGRSGYPQLRLVALMVLRSHELLSLVFGRCDESELTLAEPLWFKIPDQSLTLVDRGFISYLVFQRIRSAGSERHWLTRAKKNLKWNKVKRLGPNDYLVEIPIHKTLRGKHPEMPPTMTARAIRYQRRGFRPQVLLTSLLDPIAYPAAEIAELYHERWELELGFDEVKTHTLEREEALRSRTPERVRQEIWGLAIGYNLVRLEMERAAHKLRLPPTRISFRHSLLLVRTFLLVTAWASNPANLPRRLEDLHNEVALLVLPERRRQRSYPRAVKVKMSNYALNRRKRRG
jgi:Insertion element 4 transposase N-terminal/Transposase DDE domain